MNESDAVMLLGRIGRKLEFRYFMSVKRRDTEGSEIAWEAFRLVHRKMLELSDEMEMRDDEAPEGW